MPDLHQALFTERAPKRLKIIRPVTANFLNVAVVLSEYLSRANGLAELARNAPLLPSRVPPQGVLPTEAGAQRSLLEGIVDGDLGLDERLSQQQQTLVFDERVGCNNGDSALSRRRSKSSIKSVSRPLLDKAATSRSYRSIR